MTYLGKSKFNDGRPRPGDTYCHYRYWIANKGEYTQRKGCGDATKPVNMAGLPGFVLLMNNCVQYPTGIKALSTDLIDNPSMIVSY